MMLSSLSAMCFIAGEDPGAPSRDAVASRRGEVASRMQARAGRCEPGGGGKLDPLGGALAV